VASLELIPAQDKEFEILGLRGPTTEEKQPEHLPKAYRNETEDHESFSRIFEVSAASVLVRA
jgi:hypothetical protein